MPTKKKTVAPKKVLKKAIRHHYKKALTALEIAKNELEALVLLRAGMDTDTEEADKAIVRSKEKIGGLGKK